MLRKLNRPAPETELLTAFALVVFLTCWVGGIFVVALRGTSWPIYLGVSLLAIAGIYDAAHRAMKLTRWAWGRLTGKLLLAGVAAMTAIAAGSLANHLTFVLSGSDQVTGGQFEKFLTALAWPLLFLGVLALLVIVVTVFEIFIVALVGLTLHIAEHAFGLNERLKLRMLLGTVALRQGACITVTDTFLYAIRAIGKLAACCFFLAALGMVLHDPWPSVRRQAMSLMAVMDYEPGNTCMDADGRYGMRLDDKRRSILTMVDGSVEQAEVVNCDVAREIFKGRSSEKSGPLVERTITLP